MPGRIQPGEPSPLGGGDPGIGGEIEWTIPRMYQVSMMVPFGDTLKGKMGGYDNSVGAITAYSNNTQPAGEVVFGLWQSLGLGSVFPTDDQLNDILKVMPTGPIYWHAEDTIEGQTQMDPMNGGENIVGQNYNDRSDPSNPSVYPHHYWPDLNSIIQNVPSYNAFRGSPSLATAPDFMKLQHGANSFYQWNEAFANYGSFLDTLPGILDTKLQCGWWVYNQAAQKNILNYLFYIGGINANEVGSTLSNQKFFIKPDSSQTDFTVPARAKLYVGNPNESSLTWDSPNANGNGMPGGRYVVTVRATDKSGNADGLYYEWDIPIYLPWWATRTNMPLHYTW